MDSIILCVGYVSGSEISKEDAVKSKNGEDYYFDNIINKQLEYGAVPLWDTHRIFTIHGMAFASVVLDTSNVSEDWKMKMVHFVKRGREFSTW
ncbi:MAG: hypothetical protein LUQ70_06610 [Methanobacteriaceae archaeon]|nr:hypothetical protein [Methanobacteriaceae archaeon]